jgi:hypothetical protein
LQEKQFAEKNKGQESSGSPMRRKRDYAGKHADHYLHYKYDSHVKWSVTSLEKNEKFEARRQSEIKQTLSPQKSRKSVKFSAEEDQVNLKSPKRVKSV